MSKFNWSKAKVIKEHQEEQPRNTPPARSISKRKRKAMQFIRDRGILNFDKFGPKNPINPAFKPKSHDETGTHPKSELDVGATYGDKGWAAETRKNDSETYSTDNKVSVTQYNGNATTPVDSENQSTEIDNT